jgi:tryptophan-rich sensory protein
MNIKKLLLCVVACEMAGIAGSFFTTPAIGTWYATLNKPPISPPNWIFAPVWTLLFALMGIAIYLVLAQDWKEIKVRRAAKMFWIQLSLNVLWSAVFFGVHSPKFAFFEIIFLWLAIAATIKRFSAVSKTAAWLLVPYILWVSFAALLNFLIWQLNG